MSKEQASPYVASQVMESWRSYWPSFAPYEIRCPGCSLSNPCHRDPYAIRTEAMDALQKLRDGMGRGLKLNSAYRCSYYNRQIDSSPSNSHHKQGDAFDISTKWMSKAERRRLLEMALDVGFGGIGFYKSFLHVDLGRRRQWWGKGGENTWNL